MSVPLPRSAAVPDVGASVSVSWPAEQCILLPYEEA